MHKLTGASDIVLGLPMMGRLGSVSHSYTSMVMNLVPLRLKLLKYNFCRINTASF